MSIMMNEGLVERMSVDRRVDSKLSAERHSLVRAGDIAYNKGNKTCVLPVKLKPGTTYAVWINSAQFGNFKDADGKSAVPYLLVFQTKKK